MNNTVVIILEKQCLKISFRINYISVQDNVIFLYSGKLMGRYLNTASVTVKAVLRTTPNSKYLYVDKIHRLRVHL